MKRTKLIKSAVACCLFAFSAFTSLAVEKWGMEELVFQGPTSGNPYVDVSFTATFTQGSQTVTVPGFWDGESSYRLRFCPPAEGQWNYVTKSATPELNGKTGSVKATAATGSNHGPVRVVDTYYFEYSDGSRYHMLGTTSYQWTSMTEELQQQTLKSLSAAYFNKIRFCIFPKWYAHNRIDPDRAAFLKGADGKYDFSRPDPAFWKRFEQRILDLQKLGIEAEIILWHPYDYKTWNFRMMGKEADTRYLRYCIARLSAYRNVMWSLANEWDMSGKPESEYDRFGAILKEEDPVQHLRSVHNASGIKIFDPAVKPYITHTSIQGYNTWTGLELRAKYKAPIVFDEYGYEGNIPEGYGRNPASLILGRQYWATFSGIYGTHGECFKDDNDVVWWGKGGQLKGETWKGYKFLRQILDEAPPFKELTPIANPELTLAKDGVCYLVYCRGNQAKTIQLAGSKPYKVERLDIWEHSVTPVGTAAPGAYTFSAPKGEVVYRFTAQKN
jgi:hypothetical protein